MAIFLQLGPGKFAFSVKKGNGPVRISAVAETSVYPLGTGPFLRGMPRHDWQFTKKYELPVVMSFLPGTLTPPDSAFRQSTKYWKTSGKIELGTMPDGGAFLKRFNNQTDSSRVLFFAHTESPVGISQMMNNLVPGKLYKVRMVVSGSGMVAVKISGKKYPVKVFSREKKEKDAAEKTPPVYAEVTFKAGKESEMLELDNSEIPPQQRIGLHYVSVLSYFEE